MTADAGPNARPASARGTAPELTAEGIETYEVGNAIDAARAAKINAVRDVLATAQPS